MQRTAVHLNKNFKILMQNSPVSQHQPPPGTGDMMTTNYDGINWEEFDKIAATEEFPLPVGAMGGDVGGDVEDPSLSQILRELLREEDSPSKPVLGSLEYGSSEGDSGAPLPDVRAQAPVCYACKISVISKNVRRRTIDGEKRDMCRFCFSNIYKVLFPSEHNRAYDHMKYKGEPLPPITIPEGCDLVRVMKEASQHSRASENDPSRSPKQPRKFRKFHHREMKPELERIILATYELYHEHTNRHRWTPWTEIGEDALQRYDGFVDRDKPHKSLGFTTKKFVEQRLNTVS